ncbi:MAG: alpha/beta fold hydrolase [Spirochaetes bacterium]|nr:alpha/beta fold hydrolase [Spirochaetota bacterium]
MKTLKKKKKRTMKIVLFSIVGLFLVFSIISMIVVMVIYREQFPRYDRPDAAVTAGLRYEDQKERYPRSLVSFESGNNRLQGYVYGMNQEQGLVVVVHGLGGGADSYLPQITYFVDQGWRVFAYDATGSFDSEGRTTKGFPQALLDLAAALAYITTSEEFADLPILLFGHSWGGYAAANLLHYNYEIAGVASVSGANSPMEIILEQGLSMMGGFIYTQYIYLWIYQRILFGKTASLNAVDAINRADVPVLVIHGTEDDFVAYGGSSIISNLEEITNPEVRTITLSDTGHSGHTNLFRSEAGMDYIDEINIEYRKLYDRYEQNIPYEVKQDFYSKIDRALAQDINRDLMDEIHAFFMESIGE